MGKTVFFGGTFNPPHIAHRKMLEVVCGIDDVEKVLVAPTNIPPHKVTPKMFATKEQRLKMAELLCEGLHKAKVSNIEFSREGKSYSFYTLTELKQINSDLAMLIGGDMVTSFKTWFNYKGILETSELIVVRRKGIDNNEFDSSVNSLRDDGGKITVIEADLPEVSSTEIRDLISEDKSLDALVPKNICEYIEKNHIFR